MIRTFADVLRERRLAKGWTQERLAQRCGVALTSLQAWERGVAPAVGCLKLLATALGTSLDELLDCELPADHRRRTVATAET
jgi:transcriptional regulator with XRE-family HTH domain